MAKKEETLLQMKFSEVLRSIDQMITTLGRVQKEMGVNIKALVGPELVTLAPISGKNKGRKTTLAIPEPDDVSDQTQIEMKTPFVATFGDSDDGLYQTISISYLKKRKESKDVVH